MRQRTFPVDDRRAAASQARRRTITVGNIATVGIVSRSEGEGGGGATRRSRPNGPRARPDATQGLIACTGGCCVSIRRRSAINTAARCRPYSRGSDVRRRRPWRSLRCGSASSPIAASPRVPSTGRSSCRISAIKSLSSGYPSPSVATDVFLPTSCPTSTSPLQANKASKVTRLLHRSHGREAARQWPPVPPEPSIGDTRRTPLL
jgi:hypothetical protein